MPVKPRQMAEQGRTDDFADLSSRVDGFLRKFRLSRSVMDKNVYIGFTHRLLVKKARPRSKAVLMAEAYMKRVEDDDAERIAKACATLRRGDGYITMTPNGKIDIAPKGIETAVLHRMIDAGYLVEAGDRLIDDVSSQTYKLSSIAP